MTPNICHRQRESQIKPHGNPESEWRQHALALGYHEEARVRDYYAPGDDKVIYRRVF